MPIRKSIHILYFIELISALFAIPVLMFMFGEGVGFLTGLLVLSVVFVHLRWVDRMA